MAFLLERTADFRYATPQDADAVRWRVHWEDWRWRWNRLEPTCSTCAAG